MRNSTRRLVLLFLTFVILSAPAIQAMEVNEDHQDMEGPFPDGPSVTAACLECHEDVAHDFMKTSHWNWAPMQMVGEEQAPLGKKNIINNFCIAVSSNWPRCTSCHPGYGWTNSEFDFTDPGNIDCLVCHDKTGTYRKFPTGAGHPPYKPKEWKGKIWEPVDLAGIARSVGMPARENCGVCHFNGGGGNNVKHGDMEKALLKPALELDVHMSPDGQDFTCQECHTTENHNISGNAIFVSPSGQNHLECTSCHEDQVHDKKILDWHAKSVACQTCHIPTFARANPTKTWWDWSTAGTKLQQEKDEFGMPTFVNKKGTFKWEKNVVPAYAWFNGVAGQYLLGDQMNPDQETSLNWPQGNRVDPKAMITPFKLMKATQPYDIKSRTLVVPQLFGKTGFWKTFDWKSSITNGQNSLGMEFSGEYGFAPTVAWWKINHMVAPADQALKCKACHPTAGNGRMDWSALGYDGDPMHKRGLSRYEMKEKYRGMELN
ncbi:MAG: tetrathionate reductase family octaheme c-type cytochrome [Gemmatimonadales bacterium]|nr:tetrathionate reductase family octaheme c-type cytochrome [Gemmatimonadales bacterium]